MSETARFPHEITDVDGETNEELLKNFQGEKTGFVQVGAKKWCLPSGYKPNARHYYNFQARPDDVWIVTFARSGTTWTEEMVWLLENDLDYRAAQETPLRRRFSFLEFSSFLHPKLVEELSDTAERKAIYERLAVPAWKILESSPARRFIRTHLPFDLLPPNLLDVGCKVVYVVRNPKDVAVSFYHFCQAMKMFGYQGDFAKFWYYFENNLVPYTPYWAHVLEAWDKKQEENLHLVFYEDMKKDLKGEIRKVARFLDKDYSGPQLDQLAEHLGLDSFKGNKALNGEKLATMGITSQDGDPLIRKGVVGGWRDYFDQDLDARANQWTVLNLKDANFPVSPKY